jgi:hypothetical protein
MKTLLDLTLAGAAWTLTLLKLRALRRNGHDRRLLALSLSFLCFALTMTFQADPVYFALDRLVSVHNLAWLLSYLSLVLAIYFLCLSCCRAMQVHPPRWMPVCLFAAAALLVGLFPFAAATAPARNDHAIPQNGMELAFMAVLYTYSIAMSIVPAWVLVPAARRKDALHVRLRTFVAALAAVSIISLLAAKLVVAVLGFSGLLAPAPAQHLVTPPRLLLATAGLFPCLCLAPNRFYLALAEPLVFGAKMRRLHCLERLRSRLDRLCPRVASAPAYWWQRLANPDLYLYQALIGILDARKMLGTWLAGERDTDWDEPSREEAAALYGALTSVARSQDYDGLVTAYARLGKALPGTRKDRALNPMQCRSPG